MFKAVNKQINEDVVILAPKWTDRLDYLRSLDKQNVLVCPSCQQPVRVRAGQIKRRHFAHKHLGDCPLSHESPIVLEARAILYKWLVSKFGDAVTLEKKVDSNFLPRPIDCWISEKSGNIAYWIIESQIKPQAREELMQAFEQMKVRANWVFLIHMLREHEKDANKVHLNTTEREFMQSSDYDKTVQDDYFYRGSSLHYLDPENEVLTTFRGLRLYHEPQLYVGHKKNNEMSLVLVSPKTGEFVHPGEHEQLQKYRQERSQSDKKRTGTKKRTAPGSIKPLELANRLNVGPYSATSREPESNIKPDYDYDDPYVVEATCMICGNKTKNWWYRDNATNLCKCRDCLRKGKS